MNQIPATRREIVSWAVPFSSMLWDNFKMPNQVVRIECKANHVSKLSLAEFEEVLDCGGCPKCGCDLVDVEPDAFEVECINCTWSEENDWRTISAWLDKVAPGADRPWNATHLFT